MSKRRLILEDICQQIEDNTDFASVRISRVSPDINLYPAVSLFIENEDVSVISNIYPRQQQRTAKLIIQVWIRAINDEETELLFDQYSNEIESVVIPPIESSELNLINIDYQYAEDEEEISAATLTYNLIYFTNENQL